MGYETETSDSIQPATHINDIDGFNRSEIDDIRFSAIFPDGSIGLFYSDNVRWQRIAPAFPVGTNSLYVSDETVCGRYSFKQGETWMEDYIGKTVVQRCPAYVCRGIKPDEIRCETEDKPIFVASRSQNGAVAMATLARTLRNGVCKTPLCTPVFSGLSTDTVFGIFGIFKSVVLKFTQKLDGVRVYMQDAASETAHDVTDKVIISESRLEIPGQIINEISECTDESEPGVVLKVQIKG